MVGEPLSDGLGESVGEEVEEEEGCSKQKEWVGGLEWDEGEDWQGTKGGGWET